MFWRSNPQPASSSPPLNAVARCDRSRPVHLVGARIDTDHTVGSGQVSVTGKYDSRKDSFMIDAAYASDDNNTFYVSYGVTDEKLSSLGFESGMLIKGRRTTLDATYLPPSDATRIKMAVRQGKTKVAGAWTFTSRNVDMSTGKYELDTKISGTESIKMAYDARSHAAKIKYGKKLDAKNKVDAEYAYAGSNSSTKAVTLKLSHAYNTRHAFSAAFNYGSKKIATEWEWKTDNGPWTVNTVFPFNASPTSGEWSIKRRFEF